MTGDQLFDHFKMTRHRRGAPSSKTIGDFQDFELADRRELIERFPEHAAIVAKRTRGEQAG